MANLVAVVDPDPERRRQFLREVRQRIDFLGDLTPGEITAGPFGALWAIAPGAPLDVYAERDEAAIVVGDAIEGPAPRRLRAKDVRDRWCGRNGPPAAFDGYHAALWWSATGGLVVAADVLGLFPLTYGCRDEVVIVATSPELFRLHPLFPARLCPEGLFGLLLAHAVLDGRTLLRDVRRLEPAHALWWSAQAGAAEALQFSIPRGDSSGIAAPDEGIGRLYEAHVRALERQVAEREPVTLLLSGGMDSRLIAGILHERGQDLRSITFGEHGTYEVAIASQVARSLALPHRRVSLPEMTFAQWAGVTGTWEHLAGGFSGIHMWEATRFLRERPERCLNGQLQGIRELPLGPTTRAELFSSPMQFGVHLEVLRRLVRPHVRDALEDAGARLERAWDAEVGENPAEHWRFTLRYRLRAHPGGNLWALSFGAWPVVHLIDRELLAVIAAAPQDALTGRRWLSTALRRRYPVLARLPLDRNSHDTMPLLAGPARRGVHRLLVPARRLRRAVSGARAERRSFHRLYDIDGAGWRAIRERAEPQRDALRALFEPAVLDRLVPPPHVRVRPTHTIRDTFSLKLLIGLMLWSADHPL